MTLSPDLLEKAARFAHEANRDYCISIGDTSQPSWDDAPDWQKESAKAGVLAIYTNPETTPEQSHEGWLKHKIQEGWSWGLVKDPVQRTHPCMRPYDQLPLEQRRKDVIFGKAVRSVLWPAKKLTLDGLKALVKEVSYFYSGTLTIAVCELTNGAQVTGESNVLDPANFSVEIGEKVALDKAINKLWELEGYAVKTRGA